jgi:DNA anti-recombination protein RmuC
MSFNNYFSVFLFVTGLIAGLWGAWRKMEKHQIETSIRAVRMEDRLGRIEQQFGPNGGGLRQAVNEISIKLNKIEERQINIGEKVAKLQGEFEQHTLEGD